MNLLLQVITPLSSVNHTPVCYMYLSAQCSSGSKGRVGSSVPGRGSPGAEIPHTTGS